MNIRDWEFLEKNRYDDVSYCFSAIAGKNGHKPVGVWVSEELCVMHYRESASAERIGITRLDSKELIVSWSVISDILLLLFPNFTFIEVYPTADRIVNTGNSRWFWRVDPKQLEPMIDLHKRRPYNKKDPSTWYNRLK